MEPPRKRRKLTLNELQEIDDIEYVLENVESNSKPKTYKIEDCTALVMKYFQKRGTATFKEMNSELNIPYRRASDILNILDTTPLIAKSKIHPRISPISFCGGTSTTEPYEIKSIMEEIEFEKNKILELQQLIKEKDKSVAK
mmetsp:Transcript_36100/g.61958  ORF Transcript_36100/g.61958 Transcript_36100/m.61958 type:complete len:142 (+) Transcript_36100:185-610(+)